MPNHSALESGISRSNPLGFPRAEREKIPLLLFVVMAEPAPLPKAILPLPVVTLLSAAAPTAVDSRAVALQPMAMTGAEIYG